MIVFLTSNVFAGNVKELQNLSLQVKFTWWCGFMLASVVFCYLVLQSVLERPSLVTAACALSSSRIACCNDCLATFARK